MLKFSWKGLFKTIFFSILIFTNIFMGLYIFVNIIDWKIDVFNINPSESINERTFPFLQYPPSNSSGLSIDTRTTIVFQNFIISYSGTPSENKPFKLSAVATLSEELAEEIDSVAIYFDGASPYPSKGGMYTGSWGITLYPTMQNQHTPISFGAFLTSEPVMLTWQVQGEYFPSITIRYVNHTEAIQSYDGYKDYSLHIESAEVIEQQNNNRLTTAIAIAGAFFGFVDGSILIISYLRGTREVSNNKNQSTQSNKPKPKKTKKHRKNRRKKSKYR
ncbi:MAG: hypothetical protein ACOWW1_09745 [archaeon]